MEGLFDDNSPDLRIRKSEGDFFYRAAALIINDGKLLAVKNTNHPELYYTPGGAVRFNETTRETVLRETYEEIGIMPEIDRLAFINERFIVVDGRKCHEIVFYYLMKGCEGLEIADGCPTDQGTFETLHWLPLEELDKFNLVPPFLKTKRLGNLGAMEHIISPED